MKLTIKTNKMKKKINCCGTEDESHTEMNTLTLRSDIGACRQTLRPIDFPQAPGTYAVIAAPHHRLQCSTASPQRALLPLEREHRQRRSYQIILIIIN